MTGSETLKPALRAAKWGGKFQAARLQSVLPGHAPTDRPVAFVIGCGRSGTTIVGDILGRHPEVDYLFEPFHRWAAVDPQTDVTGLYARDATAHCILDERDCSRIAERRFGSLFLRHGLPAKRGRILVEKSPINSMRIGYVLRLAPNARFIHVLRDGREVADSISRLARTGTYRIGFRNPYNQWWGVADKKWSVLSSDAKARGYFSGELTAVTDDLARGAYEWVISLLEVDRQRKGLGIRILDLRYEKLLQDPAGQLHRVARFLDIEPSTPWIEMVKPLLRPPQRRSLPPFRLPSGLETIFHFLCETYGYGPGVR